ncbi:MAG: cupin domain-containing protein [Candidatus Limnocylindrales bacterium]
MGIPIETLPIEVQDGELMTRYVELGPMAIRHATVPAGADFGPVLQGLPDDRCPSDHWGIVLEGAIELTHADGTREIVSAGEVYFWPAGHTARTTERTVFLEVGPQAEMRQFSEHAKALFAKV